MAEDGHDRAPGRRRVRRDAGPADVRLSRGVGLASRLRAMLRERLAIDAEMITRTASIGVAVGSPGRDNTTRSTPLCRSGRSDGRRGRAATRSRCPPIEMSLRTSPSATTLNSISGTLSTTALGCCTISPRSTCCTGEVLGGRGPGPLEAPDLGPAAPRLVHRGGRVGQPRGRPRPVGGRSAGAEFSRWRVHGMGQIAHCASVVASATGHRRLRPQCCRPHRGVRLDGGSVCLEITESVVVQDIETTRKTLAGLKDVGVQSLSTTSAPATRCCRT